MYCIRFSFVTAISEPRGIRSTERDTPKSSEATNGANQFTFRTVPLPTRHWRTLFGDGEVEREIFLDIAGIRFELEKATVELRIQRREVVQVALTPEPLRKRVADQSQGH